MPKGKPKRAPVAERLHRTVDVPQADRLENVRQLAMAVREGIVHQGALLELLEVDRRHFDYYRQAATILSVVVAVDGGLALTDRGRELVATPEGSPAERAVFADAIRSARALRPFASFFAGEDVALDELAKRLEALTGLSHSTAERRARTLVQWRNFVRGPDTVPGSTLTIPDVTSQLKSLVARHNALAKQRVLEWLLRIPPPRFEQIVGDLLRAMGYSDVKVKGGSGDGGVDVEATRTDQWGHATRAAVQVKRYAKPVPRRYVDELIGVLARQRFVTGFLVTTSEFSDQAIQVSKDEPRLLLVDGPKFVDLLAEHGVVVRLGDHGEVVLPSNPL